MFITTPLSRNLKTYGVNDRAREKGFPSEFRFDDEWYLARYPSVRLSVENGVYRDAYQHFIKIGLDDDFQPSAYFCSAWVRKQLKGMGIVASSDLRHDYLNYQLTHAISPHWLFNETAYRLRFPAVLDAIEKGNLISGFIDFIRWADQQKIRPSVLFSADMLLNANGDQSAPKPFSEFISNEPCGEQKTTALFDAEYYLQQNPCVANEVGADKKYASLLEHFCNVGVFKDFPFLPDFDAGYYYEENREALEQVEGLNATVHFLNYGVYENRQPNPYFDPQYYIQRQPEVQEEVTKLGLSGVFEHFLRFGAARSYACQPSLTSQAVEELSGKALFDKRSRIVSQNIIMGVETLDFPLHDEVDVSCVIPVFNKSDYTYSLLSQLCQIANDRRSPRIEVIVVDNGSSDATTRLPTYANNLVIVNEPKPLGYTRACNLGADQATGSNILFMNNDIELFPNAIQNALKVFDEDDVGAVGGRIVLTNGVLQEAGSTLWRDGSAYGNG